MTRSRAVLVGVSTYNDPEFVPLPAAHNSLAEMHALLISPEHCGWDPRDVTVLDDPIDAGHQARRIRELARNTDGTLLLYFVGHGKLTSTGTLSLALTDTAASDPDFTGLPYDRVKAALKSSDAARKIVILDCCFAGRAIEAMSSGAIAELTHQDGTYVLAATRGSETARVAPPEHQAHVATEFTAALIAMVRAGIPGDGSPNLTLTYLFSRLRIRLLADGLPEPSQSNTEAAGEFVFAKNIAYAPPPAATSGLPRTDDDSDRVSYAEMLSSRILRAADHYREELQLQLQELPDPRQRAERYEKTWVAELVRRSIAILEDIEPVKSLQGFRLAFTVLRDKELAMDEGSDPLRWPIVVLLAAEVQLRGPLQLSQPQSERTAYDLESAGNRLRLEELPLFAALAFGRAAHLYRQSEDHTASDRCLLQRARAQTSAMPPGPRHAVRAIADSLAGYGYLPFRVLALVPCILLASTLLVTLISPGDPLSTIAYACLVSLVAPLGPSNLIDLPKAAWTIVALETYGGLLTLGLFFALMLRRWVRS